MLWIFVESERSHDEQVEVKPMLDFAGIGPPPNVQPQRVGEFLGVDVHEHRIEQMPLSPIGTPTWRTVAYIEAPGRQTMAIQFLPYVPRNEFLPDTVVFLQLYVAPNVSPSAVVSTNLPGATGPSSLGGQGPSGHGVQSPSRGVRRPRPDNPGERRPAKRPQGNSGPNIAMMHQPRPPPDDEPMADVDSYTWPGQ
ncbi:MAG: hypothetical protein M1833_002601 [Piccolia ochrophora]|nr:MAG: hypothetical protein M1833_002601 [Piccolia ochrophora]